MKVRIVFQWVVPRIYQAPVCTFESMPFEVTVRRATVGRDADMELCETIDDGGEGTIPFASGRASRLISGRRSSH